MKRKQLEARQVLEDCRYALELAEHALTDQDFRVHWVALIALLRSVGQVLKGVDGAKDKRIREKVNELWKEWSDNKDENSLFWNFIKHERDLVLKEYSFNTQSDPVFITIANDNDNDVDLISYQLDEGIFKPLVNGLYAGKDGRDIAREAIEWWEIQLQAVESTT